MNRRMRVPMTRPSGSGARSANRTARFAGSRMPRAITDITPTTTNEATTQPWSGDVPARLPRWRASCQPDASVIVTSVGMISSIFGISRRESSMRAGMESWAMIGPRTKPRNRSMPVHRPPPTTWKNSSAHRRLTATAATRLPRASTASGSPASGTIARGRAWPPAPLPGGPPGAASWPTGTATSLIPPHLQPGRGYLSRRIGSTAAAAAGLPAPGAPFAQVRPLRAQRGVRPVPRVHPGPIGQHPEDALFQVGHERAEPLRVSLRVARAAGEERVPGEQVRRAGEPAVRVVAERDAARRVAAQVDHGQPGLPDGDRVAVPDQ